MAIAVTLRSIHEKEVATILGLPDNDLQAAPVPLACTLGTDFMRAARTPVADTTHWNRW